MYNRDYRDVVGGAVLLLIGGYALIGSFTDLSVGSFARMGPGMFPAIAGGFVAILGLCIGIPALFREGSPMSFDIRSATMISLAILAFGLMIRPLGLVPSVIALTIIASFATGRLKWRQLLVLCAALCIISTLIFKVGFGLQVPVLNWPW